MGSTSHDHRVRHTTVLANPHSRHGAGRVTAEHAVREFEARGIDVELIIGLDAQDAAERAAKAARTDTDAIAVVGGDGSVRLALESTVGTGTPIGVIPAGTGNDVARNLGIPLDDVAAAVEVIALGHTRTVDLGRVTFPDGQCSLFATVAATGFDASVTARAIGMSWPKGQARYTVAALRELIGLRSRHYHVRVDDVDVDDDMVFASIGNTTSYGGGMQITPAAAMDDGMLDVTLAARPSRFPRLTFARVFPTVFSGHHVNHPMVRTLRGREIEFYCDPTALVSIDGDLVGELPATFEAVPGAAVIFAPPSA
ncbi:YegS/Rv2252/BmrU family lipid kinase [Gordonia sp. SID5947]|uniref:YegS/Rv2252/BmrU family lipid kinase n=1 Tax=Gordonia sp. SID5947 TaxID=2690315 RepID=UPI00136E1DCA|nr:YegS/Rv2252/BmrU family lipid kinase [Gordonia sp. SID5947]MYR07664.1 YegS/Rv2252/BmrU family lipid kinase [Gordonia sp. SID5947]